MLKLREAVLERIDSNWQGEIAFLRELVGHRSVLGQEAGVQQRIAEELREIGLEPELWDVDPQAIARLPGYSRPEWPYGGRPNVSARLAGSGGPGRSLTFNGHVDVVPATPEPHWRFEPWQGVVEGGRMYGRGAADMKAGVAAMIYAVRAITETGLSLGADLAIDTVIEEECTGNGTLAALARNRGTDAAIIPEPFNHTLLTAQVGVLWARITVRGRGAHVLGAEKAINAIGKAGLLLDAIAAIEAKVNANSKRPEAFADLPHPLNYNVGVIAGGDWPSSVPSECKLEVRFSAYPGDDLDAVAEQFRERLLDAAGQDEWLAQHPPQVEFYGFRAEGSSFDSKHALFRHLEQAHERIHGDRPQHYVSPATTDARFFALYHDTPVTCYGPVGGNLHAPDEWVDLQSVKDTTKVLALAAMDWCGVSGVGG